MQIISDTVPLYPQIANKPACWIPFQAPIDSIPLPERFTFPFYYEPHPLCVLAAEELQHRLLHEAHWDHNFGIETDQSGLVIGKMFGVLVVRDLQGKIGYIAAFSGKIANENHHIGFVPPVFDILKEDGFFRKGEAIVNDINRQIEALEQNPHLEESQIWLENETAAAARAIELGTQKMKLGKADRKRRRLEQQPLLSPDAFQVLEATLIQESIHDQYVLKDLKRYWKERLEEAQVQANRISDAIQVLKESRKSKSSVLQQQIFDQYYFLNQSGIQKSLADIFQHNASTPPPAGAGECAAPKLLQYAFLHQLQPLSMAEFWWGASPAGEVRKHGHYYPACRGKCEPILGHMLEGIEMDDNPMLNGTAYEVAIEILYEDDHLLVINKPPELLSVPGKVVTDSVYLRMKLQYPKATGPLVVHRLDMSTSGLMLIAKTSDVHKSLQSQFIKRTIQKRYVALLDGLVTADSGVIDLPLRVDLDDRPRQMVCYEHGKAARTEWKVVASESGKTRVHFFPYTGRTHQLRVHAAHPLGLNTAIVGDDLYGDHGDRLHLHAEYLAFVHPISREKMEIQVDANF